MDNDTNYQLQYVNRFSDIALSSTILIIIGAVIGVIGNTTIIYFYFFRIKERGERYFIPLLGVVDLLGCLTSPPYYIMDNEYMYNYPSTAACRILSSLQICVPGISAHTLLLISIQRYLLVCKPFGPKMTHFWKRVLFGVVCLISFVYAVPLLFTAGVVRSNISYMNHNVTTEVCKFSSEQSLLMTIYTTLLFLIMVANIVVTAGLYVPVFKQVRISFRSKTVKHEIHRDSPAASTTETSQATRTSDIETDDIDKPSNSIELQAAEVKVEIPNSPKKVRFEISDKSNEDTEAMEDHDNDARSISCDIAGPFPDIASNPQKPAKTDRSGKSRIKSAQKRVSILFFYLILAYVLSYIPPLIILILIYTLDGFVFESRDRTEMAIWFYLTRLVFLNHIVNPFIYGYFDTKFKKQLRNFFLRKK
ncbi:G-protein coupled receptor 84-like [Magallana gigas]|uniref:G-protein coupled receptor 84-like n=1 Tax=Magallana gigas TaxID=29159 RepID=UPI00333EA212